MLSKQSEELLFAQQLETLQRVWTPLNGAEVVDTNVYGNEKKTENALRLPI